MLLFLFASCVAKAPSSFSLVDLEGHPADPFASPAPIFHVFAFLRTDCPITNRYAPELQRLFVRFPANRVAFHLVYPVSDESTDQVRAHLREYGYPNTALRDPQRHLVRYTGATVTPEVAVLDPGRQVLYRGRIDDRFISFGHERPGPPHHDLEEAIDAALAGRPVRPATTPAVGCYIPGARS